jgi:hypothetical protein
VTNEGIPRDIADVLGKSSSEWSEAEHGAMAEYICPLLPPEPSPEASELYGAGAAESWREFRSAPPRRWVWRRRWLDKLDPARHDWLVTYATGRWLRTWDRAPEGLTRKTDGRRWNEEWARFERTMLAQMAVSQSRLKTRDDSKLADTLKAWATIELERDVARRARDATARSRRREAFNEFVVSRLDAVLEDHNPLVCSLIWRVNFEVGRFLLARNGEPEAPDAEGLADPREPPETLGQHYREPIYALAKRLFGLTSRQVAVISSSFMAGAPDHAARHRGSMALLATCAFVAAVDAIPDDNLRMHANMCLRTLLAADVLPAPLHPHVAQKILHTLRPLFVAELRRRRRQRPTKSSPPTGRLQPVEGSKDENLTDELETLINRGLRRYKKMITESTGKKK